ncbi:MFS general substrate transporter [Coniochaeta ligniaria NRRL 30616]|uniref:MFS general substrate transporter n=1 Tax=Coniochaeta ligniaria NRRL 30616 TaxID=1408157 RepID=A0A1J7JQY3_9PEZI|nr:MFS general substrate transporter [Coniochaeta ligniaria NRRL 30616]
MTANRESPEDEQTPLLLPPETSTPPNEASDHVGSRAAFYLALALIALFQAGLAAPVVSAAALMEDALCRRQNGSLRDCKDEAVQSQLAMLRGVASLTFLIPGIFLTVPFGALADRYGTRRIMAVAITGILLREIASDLIYWMAPTWPIELIWATPVFFVLGGGPPAFVSLHVLFNFVADATPPILRSSRFFQLEAAAYMGNILSYLVSSALADANPWVPIISGLLLLLAANVLLLATAGSLMVDRRKIQEDSTATPGEDGQQDQDPVDQDQQASQGKERWWGYISSFSALVVQRKVILVLLAGYWLRMLAVSVTGLQLIYVSRLFGWSYSKAAYIVSLDSAVHLAVLFLLPGAAALLTSRFSLSNVARDWWLARASVFVTVVGCAGMAFSPTPALMALSVVFFGLRAGYSSSVRGLLTSLTDAPHRSLVFSIMGTLDIMGTLIGGPLWPAIYHVGLGKGGLCVGLPFAVAAAMSSGPCKPAEPRSRVLCRHL